MKKKTIFFLITICFFSVRAGLHTLHLHHIAQASLIGGGASAYVLYEAISQQALLEKKKKRLVRYLAGKLPGISSDVLNDNSHAASALDSTVTDDWPKEVKPFVVKYRKLLQQIADNETVRWRSYYAFLISLGLGVGAGACHWYHKHEHSRSSLGLSAIDEVQTLQAQQRELQRAFDADRARMSRSYQPAVSAIKKEVFDRFLAEAPSPDTIAALSRIKSAVGSEYIEIFAKRLQQLIRELSEEEEAFFKDQIQKIKFDIAVATVGSDLYALSNAIEILKRNRAERLRAAREIEARKRQEGINDLLRLLEEERQRAAAQKQQAQKKKTAESDRIMSLLLAAGDAVEKGNDCPICFEQMSLDPGKKHEALGLPGCGHVFCKACICSQQHMTAEGVCALGCQKKPSQKVYRLNSVADGVLSDPVSIGDLS